MNLISVIILNAFSVIILCIVLGHAVRQQDRATAQNKCYVALLILTVLLLIADSLGRLEGYPDSILAFFHPVGNFLRFLLWPVLPSVWLLYVYNCIFEPEKQPPRLIALTIGISGIHTVLLILTQFYGWLYWIDQGNLYHRGPLFWFSFLLVALLLSLSTALLLQNRKKMDKQHFHVLLWVSIPPVLLLIVQGIWPGMALGLCSVVIALLIVYFHVQDQGACIDFLTGVYNRKKLDMFLQRKIASSVGGRTFSAIMIDLDNFKDINDTYGHKTGDEALCMAASLFKSCIRPIDMLARYGGDEFCIVLDTSDMQLLSKVASRIQRRIDRFNATSNNPYEIALSMGYAVFDPNIHIDADGFLKHIDKLMYESKHAKHTAQKK